VCLAAVTRLAIGIGRLDEVGWRREHDGRGRCRFEKHFRTERRAWDIEREGRTWLPKSHGSMVRREVQVEKRFPVADREAPSVIAKSADYPETLPSLAESGIDFSDA
jgi:hypothetical protein